MHIQRKWNQYLVETATLSCSCNVTHGGQDKETTQGPVDKWINKDGTYTNTGILLSHKKGGILLSATTWTLRRYAKWYSQAQKGKKLHDVTCMWNLPEGFTHGYHRLESGGNGEMLVTGCRLSLPDEFKLCGFKGQHGDYSRQSCTVHLKLAKRVDLKCEHARKNNHVR